MKTGASAGTHGIGKPIFAMVSAAALALMLASCGGGGSSSPAPTGGSSPTPTATTAANPVAVRIVGFNDLHGFIEPRGRLTFTVDGGASQSALAGGAAYLADAVSRIRAANPNTLVISAGDLFGGSAPFSASFLDEPTVGAMNRVGLDFAAVGNHEFDEGVGELERLANGGCAANTNQTPCQVEPNFPGAQFQFLAANVQRGGGTLFPASALRTLGSGADAVQIGVIGLTLDNTPLATTGSTAGLNFEDEAVAINRETASLRARGADAVVVAVHEGLSGQTGIPISGCAGLSGPLRDVLDRLDAGVDLVLSGHTHQAYVCDYGTVNAGRPFLVTSTASAGSMFTDVELTVDAANGGVISSAAVNRVLQRAESDGTTNAAFDVFTADADVEAYLQTYIDFARTAGTYTPAYDLATGGDGGPDGSAGYTDHIH